MSKQDFLARLRIGLSGLPRDEAEERLTFYSEMIDDRIEEGLTEEAAVAQIGDVEDVITQIMSDIPLSKLVKEKIKPKRGLRIWEIILLILGSPIWLSLLLAAFLIVLSVYIVIWAADITLWAADLGVAGGFLVGMALAAMLMIDGRLIPGIAMIGISLACAGIAILLFFGCIQVTKGILILTKKLIMGIKLMFVGKKAEK